MFSFNNGYTKPYAGNIRNGFTLVVRLRCAMLTNRVSQSCLVFRSIRDTSRLRNNRSRTDGTSAGRHYPAIIVTS